MRRPILVERSSRRPARSHRKPVSGEPSSRPQTPCWANAARMAVSLLPGPVIVGPCPRRAWRFAAERERPPPHQDRLRRLAPIWRAGDGLAGPGGRVAGRELNVHRIIQLRLVARPVGTLLGRPTRGPLPYGQQFLLRHSELLGRAIGTALALPAGVGGALAHPLLHAASILLIPLGAIPASS